MPAIIVSIVLSKRRSYSHKTELLRYTLISRELDLSQWESWAGSQLIKTKNSSEPSIHLMPGGAPAIIIGSNIDQIGSPSNGVAVLIFMETIIETFWPVVEENRDSGAMEIPMDMLEFLNQGKLKTYIFDILGAAGFVTGEGAGGGIKHNSEDVDKEKIANSALRKIVHSAEQKEGSF